jgi:hypothetical protein
VLCCVLTALLTGAAPVAAAEGVALRLERAMGAAASGAPALPSDPALGLGAIGLRWRILESRDRLNQLRLEGAALRGRLSEQGRTLALLRAADGDRERELEVAWRRVEAARLRLDQVAQSPMPSPEPANPLSPPGVAADGSALAQLDSPGAMTGSSARVHPAPATVPEPITGAPSAGPSTPPPGTAQETLAPRIALFAGAAVLLILTGLVVAARRGDEHREGSERDRGAADSPRPVAEPPSPGPVPEPGLPPPPLRRRPNPAQRPRLRLVGADEPPRPDPGMPPGEGEPGPRTADGAAGCKVLEFSRPTTDRPAPRTP